MGFFIFLKGYKSRSVFVNFCFNFYKTDFYILVPVRPLKVGPIRPNVSKGETLKLGLYRPIDRQRSEVLEVVNIGTTVLGILILGNLLKKGFVCPKIGFVSL